ncbi:hypothetical protein Poly24_15410 [Rosistilla carotiformis]|uniref:Type II secretion system protein F n=1 Tax=Rosistilla carotiformis TaxID=2528017 RepID=A0A518JQL4_9BACT|nr:hypothetical protein [Rosistilla carotiformis]QDV67837.1 hypothetical protein Poly24_15410 [Rosistilla carotiformis]
MPDDPLTKIVEFHKELLSLQRLGLPMELGFVGSPQSLAMQLDQIQRRLALQIERQGDVAQAIASDPDLPKPYRSAISTWVQCEHPTEVLDQLSATATARRDLHGQMGIALVGPLILLVVVYFGLISLCLVVAPRLEDLYAQLWLPVSGSLRLIAMLRDAMPIWVPGCPVVMILAAGWWSLRRGRSRFGWLFGGRRYFKSLQTAAYARHVAALLDVGCSTGKALSSVGPLPLQSPDLGGELATANVYLSTAEEIGQQVPPDDPTIAALPPMLRWALVGKMESYSRSQVLREVAAVYSDAATSQSRRWRVVLPMFLSGGIGGLLVLAYALGLMLPYIDLLSKIATQITE